MMKKCFYFKLKTVLTLQTYAVEKYLVYEVITVQITVQKIIKLLHTLAETTKLIYPHERKLTSTNTQILIFYNILISTVAILNNLR